MLYNTYFIKLFNSIILLLYNLILLLIYLIIYSNKEYIILYYLKSYFYNKT